MHVNVYNSWMPIVMHEAILLSNSFVEKSKHEWYENIWLIEKWRFHHYSYHRKTHRIEFAPIITRLNGVAKSFLFCLFSLLAIAELIRINDSFYLIPEITSGLTTGKNQNYSRIEIAAPLLSVDALKCFDSSCEV